MDFAYSPHREPGGTLHLHSPTHPHSYSMKDFSSIQQLRRSLSRSPSKPSRFHLRSADSPRSPLSPLALARAFSPKQHAKDAAAAAAHPDSPLGSHTPVTTKKKFTLRRAAPFRSSPRNRNPSKSPRRALADSTTHGNATPYPVLRTSGEENNNTTTAHHNLTRHTATETPHIFHTEPKPALHFDNINDAPIKFEFARSRPEYLTPLANSLAPAKSSPLKRSDGVMNLDQTNKGSPVAKRRSLHGASSLGVEYDYDVFESAAPTPRPSVDETQRMQEKEIVPGTPLARTSSLRKSTASQRFGQNTARSKPLFDGEFAIPGPAASKSRNRMSLDSSFSFSTGASQTPARKSTMEPSRPLFPQAFMRGGAGSHAPHPLSNTLNSSPSTSGFPATGIAPPAFGPPPTPRNPMHSKSLPIGTARPQLPPASMGGMEGSFETPIGIKFSRPDPAPFCSTGLLSKKQNRDMDDPETIFVMPDTPSKPMGTPAKRMSFPPGKTDESPFFGRSIFDQPRHEFGTPSTPFGLTTSKNANQSFGKGVNIFGSFGSNHARRGSFASIDLEETADSPPGKHMTDSHSSNEDMPPTPTKQHDGSGRRSKESSLRRRTFGRSQRTSIGTDTFAAPGTPIIDVPQANFSTNGNVHDGSPQTPSEFFMPPDASKLTISGHRRGSTPFNSSTNSQALPATPTGSRDMRSSFFGIGHPEIAPIVGLTKNDIDSALTARFNSVISFGKGEFSEVFRVENRPSNQNGTPGSSGRGQVWAVKKTKKPYTSAKDRERKLREVEILSALQPNEHIVAFIDHWEESNRLYIQTEFCEDGNLKDFLSQAGFKSRLDDFRIWKILLELSLGLKHIHDSGFIHLDMKPANILITFEGVLKIADFGLASRWPAPPHLDGEGDRHYLAPETLSGRYEKTTDIYTLGMIMTEISANIVLPENGASWLRLRSGDFTELPGLSWSSESSLHRNSKGDPMTPHKMNSSTETLLMSDANDEPFKIFESSSSDHPVELVSPPNFMIDPNDNESLDRCVQWMMHPNPEYRPTTDQVYMFGGCQWVARRRRAGATVYEGNWGPADEVLGEDMMDTS
ncbi:kinase-like protein [Amniculicola lignicola CBS 123094]|uniref:Kinase-like protein n=1 Tax=Amniculicola lignicola CBS 123094 TaxID=1392246 RepID=A0A6A5WKD7_9PLEO|nr:kinase-like protein [Amniculicola lignicola CBS 123094]